MTIIKIRPAGFAANCYLLTEDGKNAVAIDPALPSVVEEANRRGLTVRYALLTHGHFDHIGGCSALQAANAKIGCMDIERALATGKDNMGEYFGCNVPPFSVDFTFSDGETLTLCGVELRVLATPGHTAGSCCFLCGNALFTGDTLFCGDIGRTDLPTGSADALYESLRRLAELDGDFIVYAGHGADTTLVRERTHNRYLRS